MRDYGRDYDQGFRRGYRAVQSQQRPWVGGYQAGYQGGSGGVPTGGRRFGTRMGSEDRAGRRYEQDFRAPREPASRGPRRRYDRDYDQWYREFDRATRPRISPVGGTYPAMGGGYRYGRTPRPLADVRPTSEWTRWF